MLFFFGTGTSIISSHPLIGIPCINCGTTSVGVAIYSRYLHLFWIPVIPLGKRSVSQCAHCKQSLTEGQMPPAYLQQVREFKQQAKLPVSNYIVLALLGVVVAFSFVASLFK
ncbi:MAG: hypothetical protein ACRYFV_20840 [Janthinobacterium lividum]